MKLQRTTLILVLLALGLGSFVYFYEIKASPQREAAKNKAERIFAFEKDQIQAFTIKNSTETLRFERVNQKADETKLSSWQIVEPINSPASDPSVSYLLDLLVQGKSDRIITVPNSQISEYGIDKPFSTVEITLKNQKNHQLILGKPDFNRKFLYAQIDFPANQPQTLQLALVPIDFEYAVKRPLSEWQAKNEKQKQEPITSETASPSPTTSPTNQSEQKSPAKSETASPSPTTSPTNQSEQKSPAKSETASPSPTTSPTNQSEQKSPAKSEKTNSSPSR